MRCDDEGWRWVGEGRYGRRSCVERIVRGLCNVVLFGNGAGQKGVVFGGGERGNWDAVQAM